MNPALQTLLSDIDAGRVSRFYLFHGPDDFLPIEAAKAVIDKLVPEKKRSLALERIDGDSAGIEAVTQALNTYGMFGGRKVVWAERCDLFPQKSDVAGPFKRVLQAAQDNRVNAAVKQLGVVLARAGLDLASLPRDDNAAAERLASAAGADLSDTETKALARVVGLLREQPMGEGQGSGADQLLAAAERGWPDNHTLVVTARSFDGRMKTGKRLAELGVVLKLDPAEGFNPRGKGGASAEDLIVNAAREIDGLKLGPGTAAALAARIDVTKPRVLYAELEKLAVFAAGEPATPAMAREIVGITREDPFWELSNAVGERKLGEALQRAHELLAAGLHPLQLTGGIANELRRLYRARVAIDSGAAPWRGGMNYGSFQAQVLARLADGGREIYAADNSPNPFALFKLFERAGRFQTTDLVRGIQLAADLDYKLKSSPLKPDLLLQAFLLDFLAAASMQSRPARR